MALVAPGSPEESYLLVILGQYGADAPRIDPSVGPGRVRRQPGGNGRRGIPRGLDDTGDSLVIGRLVTGIIDEVRP